MYLWPWSSSTFTLPEATEATMGDMTDVRRSSAGSRHAATNSRSCRRRDITMTVADTSGVEWSGEERRRAGRPPIPSRAALALA